VISYLHRLVFGAHTTISKKVDLSYFGVTNCLKCHSHLKSGFVLSLMGHLSAEHKMGEDQAIDAAIHMISLVKRPRDKS
jgi:hypothetical protein